jgi:hypothetical protein
VSCEWFPRPGWSAVGEGHRGAGLSLKTCSFSRDSANASALKLHAPSSPTWGLLKKLYDDTVPASTDIGTPAHKCPFCGQACGRTVRACATAIGGGEAAGRKLLKAKIRSAEGQDDPTMDALFDVYLKVRMGEASRRASLMNNSGRSERGANVTYTVQGR